jgi:hypothetical protein
MSTQSLVRRTPKEKLHAFLALTEGWDEDRRALAVAICEGQTPWSAAAERAKVSERSVHTLYYHVQTVEDELKRYLNYGLDEELRALRARGKVRIEVEELPNMEELCQRQGLEIISYVIVELP